MEEEILAARAKLKERFGDDVSTQRGKGTARRKTKKQAKSLMSDVTKTQQVFKKIKSASVGHVQEVSMSQSDGTSLVFNNPQVQANPSANLYFITGSHEIRPTQENGHMSEILSSLMAQKSPDEIGKLVQGIKSGSANRRDNTLNIPKDFEVVADELVTKDEHT